MKKLITIFVLVGVAVVYGAQEAPKPKGIFSMLTAGQSVDLKNEGAAYTICTYDGDAPTSHTVLEVGEDYVILRDIAGVTETAVSVYSVKSIEKVKLTLE
ncbi:hypothetical protein Pla110_21970 [Polystyrenella longa]|uniref:Uncharacterized protein n=1 Tax=Polystyrenella longa TaxID=2528007 RepID=A0A518CML5_9PLAN|nr:hypothetical protein [Polystyrenella longa]QDU80467.1 hypothetical protein Pla110_21970 [Polystyrenella longa]